MASGKLKNISTPVDITNTLTIRSGNLPFVWNSFRVIRMGALVQVVLTGLQTSDIQSSFYYIAQGFPLPIEAPYQNATPNSGTDVVLRARVTTNGRLELQRGSTAATYTIMFTYFTNDA